MWRAREFENLRVMVEFVNKNRLNCDEFKFCVPSGNTKSSFALLYWDKPAAENNHAQDVEPSFRHQAQK